VTAVYEALAHLRSATHAYVIFHVPDEDAEPVKQTIEEARRVGRAHGVGLITMGDPRPGTPGTSSRKPGGSSQILNGWTNS